MLNLIILINSIERLVQLIEEYKSIQLAKSHYINLTKRLQEERIRFEELSLAVEKEYIRCSKI